jgi:hypothetical protein
MSSASVKIATSSEELVAEYLGGATLRDLAAKYSCSFQNIHTRLLNAGVAMRGHGKTRTILNRICPTCGRTFRPYSRNQVFCCAEHVRKKSVCVRGHELTEDNRYHFPGSASRCKQCQRIRAAAYRARKQAKAQS